MPILCRPDYNGIIYSHIISPNTRNNLKNINLILLKICRSTLFESFKNFNFTVFNNYLVEIIPIVFKLYKSLIRVKLPVKIENFLNSTEKDNSITLDPNDKGYFDTFPDQIYYFQCVCYSVNQLYIIVNIIKKNKEKLGITNPIYSNSKSLFEKLNFIKKLNDKSGNKYISLLIVVFSNFVIISNVSFFEKNLGGHIKYIILSHD